MGTANEHGGFLDGNGAEGHGLRAVGSEGEVNDFVALVYGERRTRAPGVWGQMRRTSFPGCEGAWIRPRL